MEETERKDLGMDLAAVSLLGGSSVVGRRGDGDVLPSSRPHDVVGRLERLGRDNLVDLCEVRKEKARGGELVRGRSRWRRGPPVFGQADRLQKEDGRTAEDVLERRLDVVGVEGRGLDEREVVLS